jgi:lipopolysaccharide export system permease protein
MTLISRYVVSAYLRILGLCVGSFVAIYLIIDFLDRGGRFARAGGTAYHIALYFLWKIPEIVNQILPLAVLMTTLMTLGGMSRTSEITAMRSCGISIARISAPMLALAAAISVVALAAGEFLVPYSVDRTQFIQDVLIRKNSPSASFRQNNIWFRDKDLLLQARTFDPELSTLTGVTIWKIGADMTPRERIDGRIAVLQRDRWLLRDTVTRRFAAGSAPTVSTAAEVPVGISLRTDDLKVLKRRADNMGFLELRQYTKKLQQGGYDATRYVAQMHSHLSLPFASLVMGFLGIPFALRSGRSSGIAVGIGVSLGIGFSYLIINAILLSFGQTGMLPPIVSAWAANMLFVMAGIWLTMTINR